MDLLKNTMLNRLVKYFLENRLVTFIVLITFVAGGLVTAPFNRNLSFLPRNPVPVDAIPDIGDNQQIVATEWIGRSPKDIQDQVTYPLTTALLGIPGVKTIRSTSMFGMSFVYIIFKDGIDFYWSRSRLLEKLNFCLQGHYLPGFNPHLGPMLLLWDKYSGTHSKEETQRRANPMEVGIRRNSVQSRTFTSNMA